MVKEGSQSGSQPCKVMSPDSFFLAHLLINTLMIENTLKIEYMNDINNK